MGNFTVNFSRPRPRGYLHNGERYRLWSVQRTGASKGKKFWWWAIAKEGDRPKKVSFGQAGISHQNDSIARWKKYISRHLPIRKKSGGLAVQDMTSAAFASLVVLWRRSGKTLKDNSPFKSGGDTFTLIHDRSKYNV